jgi:uncharacterized protein DUF4350
MKCRSIVSFSVFVLAVLSLSSSTWALPASSPSVEVYWDIHPANVGIPTAYTPSGRYSVLVDHLEPLGYHITEGIAPLDTVDLSAAGVLVISDGSDGLSLYTSAELAAIDSFVQHGGGLLLLTDVNGSSATARMQQVVGPFGAQILPGTFFSTDIYSTSLFEHPTLAGVDEVYFRFSSTFSPGILTPYAYHFSQPMIAAGEVGQGRVALIADSDLFTALPGQFQYFNMANNRQLATSTFAYLAIPEPTGFVLALSTAAGLCGFQRQRRVLLLPSPIRHDRA